MTHPPAAANPQPPRRRVVVTGCGMITPLGRTTAETFARAAAGESGIGYLTRFDTRGLPCAIGGQIPDSWLDDRSDDYGRRHRPQLALCNRLLLAAAGEAATQARLDALPDRARLGVAVGAHGENPSVDDALFLHRFTDGQGHWDTAAIARSGGYDFMQFYRRKSDLAPVTLAARYGAGGPNLALVSACAAGAQAIGEGTRLIREGRCDAMLAGGAESALDFVGILGFTLLKALAERFTAPERASRPFDRKRCGFVMSEGAGVVVLEELDHARARGAAILGEVLGYGDSADAYRITDTHPAGEGAVLAMRGAMADAGLAPEAVEYVNAHGTSTVQNDVTETRAIKAVLGDHARRVAVSSNKSMLGHTIAAAGAIECILSLEGMRRGVLLPTINHEFPDPKCDLDYVPNVARARAHRVVLSNSFGFGGQNACLCLGRWDE
ncbi:MAG TPA: beta-ketoacyl-[acyl-carrier-protein] synthase family protein [Acidobacteriota bacterium]|nr:beta-ketoacyl-[acyl-carrier-protein] synthase family protein [Acidobacteriota bacterium]HQM62953.1 beta-ketoacyl-[acyl-carrier-protein] synthase family protein [Acidobacteriota bacterium]